MARKPGKKQNENPVGCTVEGKDEKEVREEYREDKTVTYTEKLTFEFFLH